jgi:hypothetical protein
VCGDGAGSGGGRKRQQLGRGGGGDDKSISLESELIDSGMDVRRLLPKLL